MKGNDFWEYTAYIYVNYKNEYPMDGRERCTVIKLGRNRC